LGGTEGPRREGCVRPLARGLEPIIRTNTHLPTNISLQTLLHMSAWGSERQPGSEQLAFSRGSLGMQLFERRLVIPEVIYDQQPQLVRTFTMSTSSYL
jgi:hypothetical protein